VRLSDGTATTIGSIVKQYNSGKDIEVMAWDGHTFTPRKVTAAWCSGKRNLMAISYAGGTFNCTPNHKILTADGYKQASDLSLTDKLIIEGDSRTGLSILNKSQSQVVYGSKLGDGYLHRDPHCNAGARLTIRHGLKQIEYLKFKADILGTEVVQNGASGYTGEQQYITQTKYLDVGVTKKEALFNIDERGLAIWFCDDGSIGYNKRTREVNSGSLHVESWELPDIILAQDVLQSRFGITAKLVHYKDEKYPLLYLSKENIHNLLAVVGNYIPTCMQYKHGSNPLYSFDNSLWESEPAPLCKVAPVTNISQLDIAEDVFDITVDGLHNFVVVPHRTAKSGAVVHNCHNLLHIIRDMEAKKLWRKDYNYPSNVTTYQTLLDWVQKNPLTPTDMKLKLLKEELENGRHRYLVEKGFDLYRGQEQECLKLLPLDVSNAKPVLWPHGKVQKIIMMSATFSEVDLWQLGLNGRRVCMINTDSPIPIENRPVVYKPIVNSSHAFQDAAVITLAKWLKEMADIKGGTKGFVHTTYGMSLKLQKHVAGDSRFIFHDNLNKMELYTQWRNSTADSGLVFVGCGLDEGIDLKGPDYGWQVIAKAQYASLAEPAIKYQAENKPKEYVWDALRKCAQSCGRICRSPDDYGETYLVDSTFKKLFKQSKEYGIVPPWLDEQLVNPEVLYEQS
jgi:hypothetical protein